jgi:phosphate transport system protein
MSMHAEGITIVPQPHTSRDFESELRELRAQMLAMGARCERSVQIALKAFWEGSSHLATEVDALDEHIDRDEMDIDALALRMLALRQPVAYDLRLLAGALRLATDLERTGDEAVNIVERAKQDDGTARNAALAELTDMSDHAQQMLRGALEAFAHGDIDRAIQVISRDEAVDDIYRRTVRAMTAFMAEHPLHAAEAVSVIQVSKSLERIADHSANIAEDVIFIVRGDDVRHRRSHWPKADA